VIEPFAVAVEASQLGTFARGSSWAYPVANLIHLLGLVLLVGGIGLVDLRIAGLFRNLPLDPLLRALTPLAIAGLLLMFLSGPILFAADATALVRSDTFFRKLVLIVIALANAIAFRWVRRGRLREPGMAERAMAIASLLLWLTVAALGRMIAYN
jgi:hypothetical protein